LLHNWNSEVRSVPMRSNEFQRMITLIERTLAPHGAKVTESKLVKDLVDGTEREVDVAIEGITPHMPPGSRRRGLAVSVAGP